jgi:hypothetical protein
VHHHNHASFEKNEKFKHIGCCNVPKEVFVLFSKGCGSKVFNGFVTREDLTQSLNACYEGLFNEISLSSSWHLTWSKKWNLIITNVFTSAIFHSMLLTL